MTEATIAIEDVQSTPDKPVKMVHISGQLDESNVDQKIQEVYQVAEKAPAGLSLIFDLEQLEYMNSKSIGYLTDLYGKITENGGQMAIANAKSNILDILQVVGLTQLVKTFNSIDEAKSHVMSQPAGAEPTQPEQPQPAEPQPEQPQQPQPEQPAEQPQPEQPQPTEPQQPAEPTQPEQPQPTEPQQPAEPTQPEQPQPAEPQPEQPEQPAEPTQPEQPQPAEPQPEQPQPEQQPAEPQQPQPTEPQQPAEPPQDDKNDTFKL